MKRLLIILCIAAPSYAQPIGTIDTAGITINDVQAYGSPGRRIALDDSGYASVVWYGTLANSPRPLWNVWSPLSQDFLWPNGMPILEGRGGAPQVCVDDHGLALISSHELNTSYVNSTVCLDYLPHFGAFTCTGVGIPEIDLYNTRLAVHLSTAHLLAMGQTHDPDQPATLHYTRGTIEIDEQHSGIGVDWDQPLSMATTSSNGYALAAAQRHPWVAVAWHTPGPLDSTRFSSMFNQDILLERSIDAGGTWGEPLNITQFAEPDTDCASGDTLICCIDTFRAYGDIDLLYDGSWWDALHVLFTTASYYALWPDGEPTSYIKRSTIWHWDDQHEEYNLVADGWWPFTDPLIYDGVNQFNVQRPSLAIDPVLGWLYCTYMKYDTNCTSEQLYPMADIWISMSTNGGRSWSVGTNVTNTCPGQNVRAPGSMSERDPSLAEYVTDGFLHLTYVLDHDAGSAFSNEGVTTDNPVVYQRISTFDIDRLPLMPQYPLHIDSTGFPWVPDDHAVEHEIVPTESELSAPYPNPFNASTTISYDLSTPAHVRLTVHDLLGREVAVLYDGAAPAGKHRLIWNAGNFSSGLYFVSLRSGDQAQTQKLMLLK
ncbi:T9SS type A sorting domain-containing protein [candidate division KSB1 bacterium]|nr:T9SS type A sorting domain-containing protein [candidate division KSB1 bacterium]